MFPTIPDNYTNPKACGNDLNLDENLFTLDSCIIKEKEEYNYDS